VKHHWLCGFLSLLIIGCSAIPFELVRKDDGYDVVDLTGTMVSTCAAKPSGCEFQMAFAGNEDIREVFVPWGTPLYNEIKAMPHYSYLRLLLVDRGDGSYVLREIKEVG